MAVAGMAFSTPGLWGRRVLSWLGVRELRLHPARLDGAALAIDPGDHGHLCVVEEFFMAPLAYDLSLVPFEPSAIVDCGAHIGAFTLLARRRFPRAQLTAFEPNPANLDRLRRNLALNGIEGVEVMAAAVSTAAGRSAFHFTPMHSEGGRLGDAREASGPVTQTTVDVADLPAFVAHLGAVPLLIKLDVEGAEEQLIPALLPVLPRRCAIFLETRRGDAAWDGARGALEAGGFVVRLLRGRDVFRDGFAVRQ